MLGNVNNNINNIIDRRQPQYQQIYELDKMNTPKTKYNQIPYNLNNKNNLTTNSSINKQNVRINNNSNISKNNMNNINNINANNNMNINHNPNRLSNNQIQTNNINKALMVIKNEFKKKDDRIRALELKIVELEKKINLITKSKNNNKNSNLININQKKVGKNFTFAEKYSEEINSAYNKRENNLTQTPDMNYNRANNPFRNNDNPNVNNKVFAQTKSANQYKIKTNNDNDSVSANKNNNLNDGMGDGSVFTGNSSSYQRHSKSEVKLYLQEVKSKVDPIIFKEFIKNIKLLTNSKEKNGINKNSVIEKVRILFGEQFKDLFIKFQSILGFNN